MVNSAIGHEIGHPIDAICCFFQARIMLISGNPGPMRGFRKNILSLFRELLSKVPLAKVIGAQIEEIRAGDTIEPGCRDDGTLKLAFFPLW